MAAVYQDNPTRGSHRPLPPHHGSIPQQLQNRPINVSQSHPSSPHQNHRQGSYPSPHSSNHSAPLHRSPYPQPPGPNGHVAPEIYYQPNPYDAPVPTHYSSAGPDPPDIMAAAHMQQRPYTASVYHTPQSNSPASVASSQNHEHSRLYTQPPPQLQQPMYGYPQFQVQPNAYPQHPGQQQQHQQQMMTSQPPLPHQHSQALMQHQSPAQTAGMSNSPRPQTKLEPSIQRPMDPASLQRSPPGPLNGNHSTSSGPSQSGSGQQTSQSGGQGPNSNAAPGPIPATTPLVVRQDGNGVQWIAFEYSRDRVKMEYTIRCDVESVNTDSLETDFRTDNCVYPRACCNKDSYKGNRLQYENECNTVGWALAELNPCLRGKRGLIQRAVDSWRNSNQDPKLRSRRVRRMAKINTRKQVPPSHPPSNHMAGPREGGVPPPASSNTMPPSVLQRPSQSIGMPSQTQVQQHHHAHPDGSQPSVDDVSVNGGDFDPRQRHSSGPSPAPVRPSNVFHGNPTYPTPPNPYSSSILPQLPNGIHGLPTHTTVSASTSTNTPKTNETNPPTSDKRPEHTSLFGKLPDGKQRKFFTVDNPDRSSHIRRVQVKMSLADSPIESIPDDHRRKNWVYPRSWYPVEMQLSPSSRGPRGRFLHDRDDTEAEEENEDSDQIGTTLIKVPMLEGHDGDLKVPGLSRRARRKEEQINEIGYRISHRQIRTFTGRVMFLQHTIDVYRGKMREGLAGGGKEVRSVPAIYETRIGKRRWIDRKQRMGKGKGGRE